MNVEMVQAEFLLPDHDCKPGQIHDVPEPIAREWIAKGIAKPTDRHPAEIEALLAKLDTGAGGHVFFAPYVGEFGHLILSHRRIVYFNRAALKTVCCLPGQEVLFPYVDEFITDWEHPIPDANRCGAGRGQSPDFPEIRARMPADAHWLDTGNLSMTQEAFAIRPDVRIPIHPKRRGLAVDVCIGARRREFCRDKNWEHWPEVAEALRAAGLSFAVIGERETSAEIPGAECYSRDFGDVDAAAELLMNCRAFVGSDTGPSHLAAAVGCPLVLFRFDHPYHRDFLPRIAAANQPHPSRIVRDGWKDPEAVAVATIEAASDAIPSLR